MRNRVAHELSFSRTGLLAFAATVALASSLSVGVVNATSGRSQAANPPQNSTEARAAFESASVTLVDPKAGPGIPLSNLPPPCGSLSKLRIDGTRFAITASPWVLITIAYGKQGSECRRMADLFTGGPEWIRSDQYDIEATMPEGSPKYSG